MRNDGYRYVDIVGAGDDGRTALEWYDRQYPRIGSGVWERRFESGSITRGGEVLHAESILRAGDELHYFRAPWDEPEVPSALSILHEDAHVLAVDKPDGMPVLAGGAYLRNALVSRVREVYGPALSPLHRLGRGTTGVILFTRTSGAATAFNALMRAHGLRKEYLALVHGSGIPEHCRIETPIGRVAHPYFGDVHDVSATGRPSLTICRVLARRSDDDTALLHVRIVTGRTHQIRIHLASIGHPLCGDRFYLGPRPPSSPLPHPPALPGDAGYILHAWRLTYADPFDGRRMCITAPPRDELRAWCGAAGLDLADVTADADADGG